MYELQDKSLKSKLENQDKNNNRNRVKKRKASVNFGILVREISCRLLEEKRGKREKRLFKEVDDIEGIHGDGKLS